MNYGTTNLTTSGGFSLTPKKTWAPAGITEELPVTLGSFSGSQILTATTQNTPKGMQVVRDLFAYATHGIPIDEADEQLLMRPVPPYGWLLKSETVVVPADCRQNCLSLGKYGRYHLFAKDTKSYSDFTLIAFQAINLAQTNETVSAPVGQPAVGQGKKPKARTIYQPRGTTIDPGVPPNTQQPTIIAPFAQ